MSYYNHTHDLRSSIGYAILKEGRVLKTSSFEGTEAGREAGLRLIAERAGQSSRGYALILVAGMHYAEVRAARAFWGIALTASPARGELWVRGEAPRLVRALQAKLRLLSKLRAS